MTIADLQARAAKAERELEEARAEAAMWKANHDNQVVQKRILSLRTDLPMHMHPEREKFIAEMKRLLDQEAHLTAECERLALHCLDGWTHPDEAVRLMNERGKLESEIQRLTAALDGARGQNFVLDQDLKAARSALEDMCHQYLPIRGGKLKHDCMSAGEHAFAVLGWPDDGFPVPDRMCDEPGCGNEATSGWPSPGGSYRRTCHLHYQPVNP